MRLNTLVGFMISLGGETHATNFAPARRSELPVGQLCLLYGGGEFRYFTQAALASLGADNVRRLDNVASQLTSFGEKRRLCYLTKQGVISETGLGTEFDNFEAGLQGIIYFDCFRAHIPLEVVGTIWKRGDLGRNEPREVIMSLGTFCSPMHSGNRGSVLDILIDYAIEEINDESAIQQLQTLRATPKTAASHEEFADTIH
jgi:hypothetical protein